MNAGIVGSRGLRGMVPRVEPSERALHCPRCGYDLRGLPQPRCPECGLAFAADDWAAGVLREQVPSLLDRADLWRPDAVLGAALLELVRGALRPGRLVRKLDLEGRLAPAVVMLGVGALWLYGVSAGLLAAAAVVHEQVSPYAALKWALVEAAPRVVGLGLAQAGLGLVLVADRRFLRVRRVTTRHVLRLASHWLPACAAWLVVPMGIATLALPEAGLGLAPLWTALPLVPFAVGPVADRRRTPGLGRAVLALGALAAAAGLLAAARWVLPESLEPGVGVYF